MNKEVYSYKEHLIVFLRVVFIGGAINVIAVLINFEFGVLIGLLVTIFYYQFLFNKYSGYKPRYLLLGGILVFVTMWFGLTFLCNFANSTTCQENLLWLSFFPASFLLMFFWVFMLLLSVVNSFLKRINHLEKN